MKQMGMAVHGCASTHGDRTPQIGVGDNNFSYTDFNWYALLNWQYFKDPYDFSTPSKAKKFVSNGTIANGPPADGNKLFCPSFINAFNRGMYLISEGVTTESLDVPPPEPYFEAFVLGTKLSRFESSSNKFLIIEAQTSGNYTKMATPSKTQRYTPLVLGNTAGYPSWSANSGYFAFRHGTNASPRANFLFVDGHVESMAVGDQINSKDRVLPRTRW
jgi:prepilin-type processing-associated H-X9-DG protein